MNARVHSATGIVRSTDGCMLNGVNIRSDLTKDRNDAEHTNDVTEGENTSDDLCAVCTDSSNADAGDGHTLQPSPEYLNFNVQRCFTEARKEKSKVYPTREEDSGHRGLRNEEADTATEIESAADWMWRKMTGVYNTGSFKLRITTQANAQKFCASAQATGMDTKTNARAKEANTNLNAQTNGEDAYTNTQATGKHTYTQVHRRGDAYTNTKAKEKVAKARTQATKLNMIKAKKKVAKARTQATKLNMMNTNASSPPGRKFKINYEITIRRCLRWMYNTVIALMPMVCMGIAVTLYCLFGAWLFLKLEGPQEGDVKESVDSFKERICKEIYNIVPGRLIKEEGCPDEFRQIFTTFKEDINWFLTNPLYDENGNTKWTFSAALLFAITVVTTIGYGHIAPVSFNGRVATILFGLFGIPLTLLCLANIGDYMAKWFRWMYHKACTCFKKRFDKHGATQVPLWLCGSVLATYLVLGAWLFSVWEEWTYIDSLYFCYTTLATIGFGDLVPGLSGKNEGSVQKKLFCALYLIIGLTLVAMSLELLGATASDMADRCFQRVGIRRQNETEREKKIRLAARETVDELFIGEPIVAGILHPNVKTNIDNRVSEIGNSAVEKDTDPSKTINTGDQSHVKSQTTFETRCLHFATHFTVFFMSTAGLAIFVAIYCMIGAWLFTDLEGPKRNETDWDSLEVIQNRTVKKLRRFPVGSVPTQGQLNEYSLKADALLTQFREHVSDLIMDISYDDTGHNKWTFVGALLYSVSVVTTIGYGNTAPVTTEGRVTTMVYGLFGIPLTLVFLNNLGGYMAQFIRFFYDRVVCRLCAVKNRGLDEDVKPRVPVFVCIALLCAYLLMGALIFNIWEGWSYNDSVYFCFVTLTTIGFGDLVPGYRSNDQDPAETVRKQTTCMFYVLIGLALVATCFELMKVSCIDIFRCVGGCCGCYRRQQRDLEADNRAYTFAVKTELLSRIQEETRKGSVEFSEIVEKLKQRVAREKMSLRNIRSAGSKRVSLLARLKL